MQSRFRSRAGAQVVGALITLVALLQPWALQSASAQPLKRLGRIASIFMLALILAGVTNLSPWGARFAQAAPAANLCQWTGFWTGTGAMSTGRMVHTATLLPSGKVLITGGSDGNNSIGVPQLYDPATGTFSPTGPMTVTRHSHTATLLPNGTVLIAGGYGPNGATPIRASAELYDPATETFTATGSMGTPRQDAAAVLLPNGQVLVAGGATSGGFGIDGSAELYDPASRTFVPVGSMVSPRYAHTATLLGSGLVLVAGGFGLGGATASAEIFNPTTLVFSVTGSMADARGAHTATRLLDGSVAMVGGQSTTVLASVERYFGSGFSTDAPLTTPRWAHTATLLPEGGLLIAGGNDGTGSSASVEVLFGGPTGVGPMGTARMQHTATILASGQVLIAGGRPVSQTQPVLTSAELFDPPFRAVGPMSTWRQGQTANLLTNGKVLIAGGAAIDGYVGLASAELFDPVSNTLTSTGAMASARRNHTATRLANGKILIAGGDNAGARLSSAELYDPGSGMFSPTGSLATGRAFHSATLLPNGKVLIAGGASALARLASAELYDPATGTFSPTGSLNKDRIEHTATLLPGGKVLVAGGLSTAANGIAYSTELYDFATGMFILQPNAQWLLTNRQAHTATLLSNGLVLMAGGHTTGQVATNKAELYDPASGFFSPTGAMTTARSYHVAVETYLPDGKVMVAGGSGGPQDQTTASVELYSPVTGTFAAGPAMNGARARHTGTLLNDGRVLLVGGSEVGPAFQAGMWAELSKTTQCGNLALTPTGLTFSLQTVGIASPSLPATLTNSGSVPVSITSITTSGDFATNNSCPISPCSPCSVTTSLAVGASCSISISFTPTAAGTRTGTLVVASNAPGSPVTVALSGTGIVRPANDNFANASAVKVSTIKLPGLLTGSTQNATTEAGEPLHAGDASCFIVPSHRYSNTVWFKFTPTASGDLVASTANPGTNFDTVLALYSGTSLTALNLIGCDNNGDSETLPGSSPQWSSILRARVQGGKSYFLQLGGVGGATAGNYSLSFRLTPLAPAVGLAPTSLNLGKQQVGQASIPQTVTLTNTGTAPLSISSIAISGDFILRSNCPSNSTTLGPGGYCQIDVAFTPTIAGAASGSLTITDNAAGSVQTVALSGTGTQPPGVYLSPASATFGTEQVGVKGTIQQFTLTNTMGFALKVLGVGVLGPHAQDFVIVAETCSMSAVITSCTIDVMFIPTDVGARTSTLRVDYNTPNGPATAPLSGTGR